MSLSWQKIFHLSVWGGLALAAQWDREQDWKGKIKPLKLPLKKQKGKIKEFHSLMKLRNSSGARIAWEGRETPNIPLSYFFPQFLLLSTLRSAVLAAPSQIPVHPQPQWENQKRF